MGNNMRKEKEGKMSAREACNIAKKYFWELLLRKIDLQIEETEMDTDEKNWLITISYEEKDKSTSSLLFSKKLYKKFKVDAINGVVKSMKIRKI